MIGNHSIKLGTIAGNDGEIQPGCLGFGPMTQAGDRGARISEG
jgi:hypothetical protein